MIVWALITAWAIAGVWWVARAVDTTCRTCRGTGDVWIPGHALPFRCPHCGGSGAKPGV